METMKDTKFVPMMHLDTLFCTHILYIITLAYNSIMLYNFVYTTWCVYIIYLHMKDTLR